MTYFESLSFFKSCELVFFVFGFSMIVRYGFHYADWTLEAWKDFFQFLRQLFHRKPRP